MAKPEIRLKGFEGEWKIIPFSSFATLRRGLTYSPSDLRIKGVRVLRSSNIVDDTFVISKDDVFVRKDCVGIELAKEGDILITAANGSPKLVGKHCIIKNNDKEPLVHGGFMLLASSKEPYFLNASMSSSWFVTFQKTGVAGGNGAIGNLSKSELEVYNFFIPKDKNERNAIAEYFKSLDSMLQSTTKKIESLKQMKQACLVSMFPQAGETTPRVRFKGFEGEWVVKKLSSIANRVTRKNTHLESTLPLTISAAEGLIEQTSFFNNVVASSNVSGYYLVKKGEFAYNKSYSNGYPFGAVKRLDRFEKGVLSTLYIVFSIDKKVSSDYIVQFFETSLWHQEVAKRAAEGARNHGLLNIGADDFLDINLYLPNSKDEQQRIASYFRSLDKQISMQEQKLEKLKQIKAACLDKMFV